jgi:hypothetical protein
MRSYTPEEIRKAIAICGDVVGCTFCPLAEPAPATKGLLRHIKLCANKKAWSEMGPYYQHPTLLNDKERQRLYEEACRQLCDPLYLDMLKVKESL